MNSLDFGAFRPVTVLNGLSMQRARASAPTGRAISPRIRVSVLRSCRSGSTIGWRRVTSFQVSSSSCRRPFSSRGQAIGCWSSHAANRAYLNDRPS